MKAPMEKDFSSANEKLLLRCGEAADLCGCSDKTWRHWYYSGRVPAPVRIGRSMFWRREEIIDWVAAGCPSLETWKAMQPKRW